MDAEYATDPRMKLNLGIRRRLAPLLDNGRDEVELMTAILFSLPGSPVIYYGDEIGMGDNVYLGDRDGVRTPMQWTGDRNGGFSRADFAQLYLPPLMDPVYGYQAVNVEAQLRTPTSLLRWLHRFIELRKAYPVLRASAPTSRCGRRTTRILAHVRRYGDDIALCVHNLARSAQAAELDLSRVRRARARGDVRRDRVPADRRAAVPAHVRAARLLLVPAEERPLSLASTPRPSCSSSCAHQRWFGAKSEELTGGVRCSTRRVLREEPPLADALVELRYASGNRDVYQLVLGGGASATCSPTRRSRPGGRRARPRPGRRCRPRTARSRSRPARRGRRGRTARRRAAAAASSSRTRRSSSTSGCS